MATQPVLELRGVRKTYGELGAVRALVRARQPAAVSRPDRARAPGAGRPGPRGHRRPRRPRGRAAGAVRADRPGRLPARAAVARHAPEGPAGLRAGPAV